VKVIPTVLAALWLSASALFGAPLAGKRPNIICILTDDQGYGDISAHGNPVLKTPHLDRLRQEGVHLLAGAQLRAPVIRQ
jgi:arylsulfatase